MNSKKANWNIDSDVIRYRTLDANHKFLPDSLSLVHQLSFLSQKDQRFISQIQGRSYAYIFALVERFQLALMEKTSAEQMEKVLSELQPLINHVGDVTYQDDILEVA